MGISGLHILNSTIKPIQCSLFLIMAIKSRFFNKLFSARHLWESGGRRRLGRQRSVRLRVDSASDEGIHKLDPDSAGFIRHGGHSDVHAHVRVSLFY